MIALAVQTVWYCIVRSRTSVYLSTAKIAVRELAMNPSDVESLAGLESGFFSDSANKALPALKPRQGGPTIAPFRAETFYAAR